MSIITDFFDRIDNVGGAFVINSYDALSTAIQTPLAAAMVLYFCYLGYMITTGYLQLNTYEIVSRVIRMFLIYGLLIGWGSITGLAYNLFNTLPGNIAKIINGTIDSASADGSYVATQLSTAYDTIINLAESIINKSPGWSSMILYGLMAIVVLLFGLVFIIISTGVVVAAKMTLWIVFALGPIFILMAMFDQTRQYFTGWINYLVQVATTITMSYVFLSFYLFILRDSMARLSVVASSTETVLSHIGGVVLLMGVGSYIILQVPSIAAAITGGMAMGNSGKGVSALAGKGSRFVGGQAAKYGWKGAKATGRGAKAVGRGVTNVATKGGKAAMQAVAKKNLS